MEQRYFVSYFLVPSLAKKKGFYQQAVFRTDDLESILIRIIPTRRRTGRGKIRKHVQEFREHGRVTFGKSDNPGVIKYLKIRKVPDQDWDVLSKYFE